MAPRKTKPRKRKDWSPPGEAKRKAEKDKQPINGLLVRLVPGEGNAQTLEVQVLGDVKVAESPTLLRLAAQNAERQLGIG